MSDKAKESASLCAPSTLALPPKLGAVLTELTENANLDAALRQILADYVKLKIEALTAEIARYEDKWGMTFEAFAGKCAAGTLGQDTYAYDVEKDYWAWEEATTLRDHYATIEIHW